MKDWKHFLLYREFRQLRKLQNRKTKFLTGHIRTNVFSTSKLFCTCRLDAGGQIQ